jgi:hypothetical protein
MKFSNKQINLVAGSAILLSAFCALQPASAQEWKASILPASLNADNTVRLLGRQVQMISFALQADKAVTARGETHHIEMEIDHPVGFKILGNGSRYASKVISSQTQGSRVVTRYQVEVANKAIAGAPGARIMGEGNNQSMFVSVPDTIEAGQEYLVFKIKDDEKTQQFRWPLEIREFTPAKARPKRTSIGLWDYTYARAITPETSAGIAKMLHDSGVNFVQKAENPVYRNAMKAQGITTGGYTHHGVFFNRNYADVAPTGKPSAGSFPDAYTVANLPSDAKIPGVSQLVQNAKDGDGIATFDYEPKGASGFSQAAIAKFKEQYKVSDADFKLFQQYVAQNGMKTFLVTDPKLAQIWRQWTAFRSHATSNYVRRISEAFHTQAPEAKLLITSSSSAGADSLKTHAIGTDNAAMAKYADIMMPQVYSGYGGANAKLVMQMTTAWRNELKKQNAKTQLWPLLLVRYSGANTGNSPARLRQQIIGSLAHGANGVGFYYPVNMDGGHWEMLARATEEIAHYEDFYQDGERVDNRYALSALPKGSTEVQVYPGYNEPVENPGWAFTAHRLGNRTLLTLFNLEEGNDLVFGIDTGNSVLKQAQNAQGLGKELSSILEEQTVQLTGVNQWLVGPGQVGFIVLEEK